MEQRRCTKVTATKIIHTTFQNICACFKKIWGCLLFFKKIEVVFHIERIEVVFHISSTWVKIRLYTEYELLMVLEVP
jgi:hypothetical protein